MWYILQARPGAQLILGLEPGVSRAAFRQALAGNNLEACLHYLPVQAGDAVFVAAGTVHSLLEGILAVEVQQNSDTTYRVYDWGRLGADGQPRPLHVDRALEVIDFGQVAPGLYQPVVVAAEAGVTRSEISRSRYFVVEKVTMAPGAVHAGRTQGETLEIWGTLHGRSQLTWAGEVILPPQRGRAEEKFPTFRRRFCLVPAGLGIFAVPRVTGCSICIYHSNIGATHF
jgi:mannose-6-phosphate isomerase